MSSRTAVDPRFGARLRQLRTGRGWSLRQLAAAVPCSHVHVWELENGRKVPSPELAARLDGMLHADGQLAAMVSRPGTGAVPPRRAGGVALLGQVDPGGRPMDTDDAAALRETVTHLVALDNAHGSDDIADLAVRVFTSAAGRLASGAYLPAAEADLYAAAGEVGELAAWLLYDADRQEDARRVNTEAMTLTRAAGDRTVELLELANLAMQSVHLRRGQEALRTADDVLTRGGLSPRVTGLFHMRRARALAVLGARGDALAAYDRAQQVVRGQASPRDPAWAWWIDDNELTWHAAMLHTDLGDHHYAADLFTRAATDYPPFRRRGHFNNLAHLLEALATVRAWGEAEPVVRQLAGYVGQVGSARTVALLLRVTAGMRRAGLPSSLEDQVATLHQRLRAVS